MRQSSTTQLAQRSVACQALSDFPSGNRSSRPEWMQKPARPETKTEEYSCISQVFVEDESGFCAILDAN